MRGTQLERYTYSESDQELNLAGFTTYSTFYCSPHSHKEQAMLEQEFEWLLKNLFKEWSDGKSWAVGIYTEHTPHSFRDDRGKVVYLQNHLAGVDLAGIATSPIKLRAILIHEMVRASLKGIFGCRHEVWRDRVDEIIKRVHKLEKRNGMKKLFGQSAPYLASDSKELESEWDDIDHCKNCKIKTCNNCKGEIINLSEALENFMDEYTVYDDVDFLETQALSHEC